ncbi:hypothetical protein BB561_005136, partial [Smittium simulii]
MRAVTLLSLCISCVFYKAVNAVEKNAVVDSYAYPTPANISYATMKEKCILKYGSEVFVRDNEKCTCLDDGKIDCIRIGYAESKLETCIRVQGGGKNPYISENLECECQTDGTSECTCLDTGKIDCIKIENPDNKLETCIRVQGGGKNPYIWEKRACVCMPDGTTVCGPVYDSITSTNTEISIEKKNCIVENGSEVFLRDNEQCICLDDGKLLCFSLDNPDYRLETCARVQGRGKNPYIWENRACICMTDGTSVCGP